MSFPTLLTYAPLEQSRGGVVDWKLAGKGERSSEECGQVIGVKACVSHKEDYVLLYRRCFRPECPICYESWVNREASRSSERLKKGSVLYKKMGICKHIVLSPPQAWAIMLLKTESGYKKLRNKAVKMAKKCGVLGGTLIFHPFRKKGLVWCLSPHFHIVGYGYLKNAKDFYEETGWVYVNKGERKTIFGTVSYQLSHSGLGFVLGERKFHSLTWFGLLSYNKILIESEKTEIEYEHCKICGELLHRYVPCHYGRDYYDEEGNWIHSDFRSWLDDGFYTHVRVVRTYIIKGDDKGG